MEEKTELGYGDIKIMPEFHFDSGYEAHCVVPEESAQEWKVLFSGLEKDEIAFFETFRHDLVCCLYKQCGVCHLRNTKGCKHILYENAKKMIDNQMRMCMELNRQRKERKNGKENSY